MPTPEETNVININAVKSRQRIHEDLLRRLRARAGDDPHPQSVGALLREAADALELTPPWLGLAEQSFNARLMARLDELEREVALLASALGKAAVCT